MTREAGMDGISFGGDTMLPNEHHKSYVGDEN
jgi:hypothetical protein